MCQLATSVVSEGKTSNPVLWQSAKAWIEFMFGDHRQGIADIEKAVKMEGEERMKENARVLKLYMTAAEATPGGSFDDYLAQELEWIDKRAKEDNSFLDPRTRLVHQVLVKKYSDRPLVAVSLLKAIDSYDRLTKARDLAEQLQGYVILKGHYTAVCMPDGHVAFNSTGNAGMATAGSGDVLTGIVTGLLARGYGRREACLAGVYLHGLAGDMAARELGEESLMASDIISYLPKAFLRLRE